MTLIHVENNDSKKMESASLAVIDFYADWCGPCKIFAPIFESTSHEKQFDKFSFFKVDVDNNENVAGKYSVMSIPTTIILKDGKEIARQTGYMAKDAFANFLKSNV